MKFRHIKYIFIIFVIIIVLFAIFKMNNKNNNNQNNQIQNSSHVEYQDNFRLGISNFDTINPLTTKNKEMLNINHLIYEPLLSLDSEYKLQPCLATEYAKTSATTYIIKIDNTIKWSNGSNLTSKDVKFTIDLIKKANNSIYAENVKNIENVEIIDDSTIKINLNKETYFFEHNLIFPIMNQDYYNGEDFFNTSKYPIGTGLYKISSVANNQIVLEKSENYRNNEKINKNIQKIVVTLFNSIGEVYNSFKIGNIDVINTSNIEYEKIIGTIGYYAKEYKGREIDFLSCNCNDYLMKQKSVRQAINYAIDKENIVSTIYNNNYYVSNYILDFGCYAYTNNSSNSMYNIEKAKEILIADGWVYTNNKWRKNGYNLYISISVNSSNIKRVEVAKLIKNQLEKFGIQVNIIEMSDSQYKWALENKNYQILLSGIYNSYSPDLTYFYGSENIANYKSEDVLSILNEVKNITDQKVLSEKYKVLIGITQDECPYISLYRNKNSLLINQNVIGNFEPNNFLIFRNFESWNRE